MSYTAKLGAIWVFRDSDGEIIVPDTPEWEVYQEWLNEGNTPNPPTDEINDWNDIVRDRRNALLSQTDWTQVVDVPESIKTKWTTYRQQLRDVPEQSGFPFDIEWPTKPE